MAVQTSLFPGKHVLSHLSLHSSMPVYTPNLYIPISNPSRLDHPSSQMHSRDTLLASGFALMHCGIQNDFSRFFARF